jgi:hypothetical protein
LSEIVRILRREQRREQRDQQNEDEQRKPEHGDRVRKEIDDDTSQRRFGSAQRLRILLWRLGAAAVEPDVRLERATHLHSADSTLIPSPSAARADRAPSKARRRSD